MGISRLGARFSVELSIRIEATVWNREGLANLFLCSAT